jgi:hypothetical protein
MLLLREEKWDQNKKAQHARAKQIISHNQLSKFQFVSLL